MIGVEHGAKNSLARETVTDSLLPCGPVRERENDSLSRPSVVLQSGFCLFTGNSGFNFLIVILMQ